MTLSRRFSVLALVAASLFAVVGASQAAAQGEVDVDYLDSPNEVGRGTCSPERLVVGQPATCRFPVIGANRLPNSPYHAYVIQQFADSTVLSSKRCLLEGDELVCGISGAWTPGEFDVGIGGLTVGTNVEGRASITVDPDDGVHRPFDAARLQSYPGEIVLQRYTEPQRFTDHVLLVRREGSDEVVQQVASEAGSYNFTFRISEPGRWTVAVCAVALRDPQTCRREGHRQLLEILDPTPIALVPGHNGPSRERINLVFVGNGFGPIDELSLQDEALRLLGLSGEPEYLQAEFENGGSVRALHWGTFSIDPFRDNVGRFNFWFMEDEMAAHGPPYSGIGQPQSNIDPEALGLGPDTVLVLIDRANAGARASTTSAMSAFEFGPGRGGFGSVYLPFPHRGDDWWVLDDRYVLAHELGHALFGLLDEYDVPGRSVPTTRRPNCAPSQVAAERLWSDLVGDLDPMFDRWRDELIRYDLLPPGEFVSPERFTVGYFQGGCSGEAENTEAIRPTADSAMRSFVPVFGSVNRRWMERILSAWPEPQPRLGGVGPDAATCGGLRATIVGSNGDDHLIGTPGPDVIAALEGNDRVVGLGGDDVLCGGKGDDVIYGGSGFDIIYGAQGTDEIYGADGAAPNERSDTAGGRYFGGAGDDSIYGTTRWDRMQGGIGNDLLIGYEARDWIRGGAGSDRLEGLGAIDDMNGGYGNDVLLVGEGDVVKGGPGKRDRCIRSGGEPARVVSCERSGP